MDKKTKTLIVAIALALIVAIASTSYAFFTIANKEGNENVITSGTMGLHLEDGAQITLNDAIPGASVTKTFYVENTGNVDTAYDIYLSEVVNTFVDKTDLVYELTSSDGGYSTTGQVEVPSVSAKIVDSKAISVSGIHHYTLTITFLAKNENQDDNQGVEFSGKIQVNEYIDAGNDNDLGCSSFVDNILEEENSICNILTDTCDLNTVGNEVRIDKEHFYVIGKENGKTKLLAKYNLLYGNVIKYPEGQLVHELNECDDNYGKQSIYTTYYDYDKPMNENQSFYGASFFADEFYWEDTTNYPAYVYNDNSNLYEPIQSYVSYLNSKNINVTGRLIRYDELIGLGCQNQFGNSTCTTAPDWVHLTSYWTGTANGLEGPTGVYEYYFMYVVQNNGGFLLSSTGHQVDPYYYSTLFGIRPVIIIE